MRFATKLAIAAPLASAILHLSVMSASADQIGYAVDDNESLYKVDLTTATATPIGNTGQFLQGLAISPQGSLFGTDSLGNLYSVNKTTGATSFIGDTGLGDIEGLSFRGATLIGTDFSGLNGPTTVYAIDTSNGMPTAITSFSQGPVRALAVANTNTIDVASDSPVSQSLVQVNLLNGTNTSLGLLPSSGAALIAALNFGTDGTLYALDPFGNDYMLASNGAGILIGNTGNQYWLDLTMASTALDPVDAPEPSSMALLVTAALGLVGYRLWRKSAG